MLIEQLLLSQRWSTLNFNFHLFTDIVRNTPKICGQNDAPRGVLYKSEGMIRIFSFPAGYSIDGSLSLSLSLSLSFSLSFWYPAYPAGPIPLAYVTVLTWALPRLIHYSAWPIANDFRYIRFSRGRSIARRLSLPRDAGGALNGPAWMFDFLHAHRWDEIAQECGSLNCLPS